MDKIFDKISSFDEMENLESQYQEKYGIEPFNLSYWDPSKEFADKLYPYIKIDYSHNPINYLYTFQIEKQKEQILLKLGFDPSKKDGILTNNGTSSIMMMVHWIKANGFNKLNIINPAYFSLHNNCKKEGISIIKHEIDYRTGIIKISPQNYKNEIFWITNPAYSTGINIIDNNIELIKTLLNNNVIVVDNCVAQNNRTISHLLGNHSNFYGIYAPHKSICMNGVKFSIIVFNFEDESFFDQSIDFLSGGLNCASLTAIQNFLTEEYDNYRDIFQKHIENTNDWITELCNQLPQCYYTNKDNNYLASIYFPNLPYEFGGNRNFLWNLMDNTGGSFITGLQNEFPKDSGFSFRINLTRDSPQFRATLKRILFFLSHLT